MSREAHAQFCGRLGVRLPEATYRVITCKSAAEAQSALHQAIRKRGHLGNMPRLDRVDAHTITGHCRR